MNKYLGSEAIMEHPRKHRQYKLRYEMAEAIWSIRLRDRDTRIIMPVR